MSQCMCRPNGEQTCETCLIDEEREDYFDSIKESCEVPCFPKCGPDWWHCSRVGERYGVSTVTKEDHEAAQADYDRDEA